MANEPAIWKSPEVDVEGVLNVLFNQYQNRSQALIKENAQNSVDAHARHIWVRFNPARGVISWKDDGDGIPLDRMNSSQYFSVKWSNKPKGSIGSWGVGRLVNLPLSHRVTVTSRYNGSQASFYWRIDGSHQEAPIQDDLGHTGMQLLLEGVPEDVIRQCQTMAANWVQDLYSDFILRGVQFIVDGQIVPAKEYRGTRRTIQLEQGAVLELYWNPEGQLPHDQGLIRKYNSMTVGEPTRLGIQSDDWTNLTAVLRLGSNFPLTANREAFQDTPGYQLIQLQAQSKIRGFLSGHAMVREREQDRRSEEYTKRLKALFKKLGLELKLTGTTTRTTGSGRKRRRCKKTEDKEPAPEVKEEEQKKGAGGQNGFRIRPVDFRKQAGLENKQEELTYVGGGDIWVNIGHRSCPKSRQGRALWAWSLGFIPTITQGVLTADDKAVPREKLLTVFQAWLTEYDEELAKF